MNPILGTADLSDLGRDKGMWIVSPKDTYVIASTGTTMFNIRNDFG